MDYTVVNYAIKTIQVIKAYGITTKKFILYMTTI